MTSKYRQIAETLQHRIADGIYQPDSMLPTEQQLCAEFSASRQTVRQALKCLMDDGLISRRQGSGSRVVPRTDSTRPPRRIVAVIATYISNYIFPSILREVESCLSANNCTPLLYATSNQISNERQILLDLLEEKNLDGILVEGTKTALPNPNLDLYARLMARNIPMVFLHGEYPALKGSVSVLDDNYAGGYQLAEYLLSKNHTRIAGIFKSDDIQGHQRYAGFAEALRDHRQPVEDRNVFWYRTEDKDKLTPQSNLWHSQILPVLKGCTAVVCYNDEVASFVIQSLLRDRIEVPGQMAVVSFDNSLISNLSACTITSLSHGTANIGRLAAETLIRQFQGQQPHSVKVPWVLVEKESS